VTAAAGDAGAATPFRLPPQPGELLDRGSPLPFTWNRQRYVGFAGDTIASALAAAGVRIFSRSFKYHRPRGILTASFHDPGCTVQVDEEPNVRAGHRMLQAGMAVTAQNVWPSLRYDARAANQLAGRFLTAGFYYKTFMKPQRLWPAYEKVLQRFASGGRTSPDAVPGYYDQRYAHPDVLVAGGGPAGMAAATAAANAGARVMLVEEEHQLGGSLRWGGREDLEALAELRAGVAQAGVDVLVDSVVAGRYDDNWISVVQRGLPDVTERLIKARAAALVVAPGLIERPYVFAGNDLPGVLLSTAARRLVNLYAVRPGSRAVVFTANPEGDSAAADLDRAGVEIVRLLDARRGADLRRAVGRRGLLAGVELNDGAIIDCDLLVTATGWTAPTSLLNMAGDRPGYDPAAARFRPGAELPDTVFATGGVIGDGSRAELIEHGARTGAVAAARAGLGSALRPPPLRARPHPALFRASTHGMVDFSEDVSSKDVFAAAAEGYDSSELLKRYTTAAMGPTQGKLETVNTVAVLAEATGRPIAELGTTVWRPPYAPITLGALAGRIPPPARYSPMQPWHEAHGAVPLVAGDWIRPDSYGDPMAEARNVRERVGIIDVTPLGKLDLRGPDVPQLLSAVYVNKWARLDVGSVRYGVMCAEDGVVMDDGVTGRLGPQRFLTSTTSTGAAAVWEHLESVLQLDHPEWRVHIAPLTTYYASINIAGPSSRELLGRLTDVDLDAAAFPYMRVRTGAVADVAECVVWRIGFTGELSYEIHVPASYGLHVWEALLAAGADLGVRPFGVEAQRILRLEKGHLIVGQDTDGLTKALDAGLDWLVKLDKDDFVGRPELIWQHRDGAGMRLVGLQPVDPALVPAEASQIVRGEHDIVGRITSSRMSPTLGRSVCLAYLRSEYAEPGTTVMVQLPDRRRIAATVTAQPAHVDPEGARLRG
jgi:sarcosine oxidase subunit alpha